jgi:hypothetical protein
MMKLHAVKLLMLAAFAWLAASASPVAAAAPVVLFDQSHDQRFVIEKDEPLQLSGFASLLREEGFEVRSSAGQLTADSLGQVDVLVVSGPFRELAAAEVEAVAGFLARGGRLAAMLHIGSPFAGLMARLEVDFTNYVLYEQENVIDNDPRNFRVTALSAEPIFAGIDHFSLYGGWALMNTAPSAKVIATTSPRAWVDLNGDQQLSKGDVVGSFGVVVSGDLGNGRFIVFGDDAIFQNKFLDNSNRQLAKNLARWLK